MEFFAICMHICATLLWLLSQPISAAYVVILACAMITGSRSHTLTEKQGFSAIVGTCKPIMYAV